MQSTIPSTISSTMHAINYAIKYAINYAIRNQLYNQDNRRSALSCASQSSRSAGRTTSLRALRIDYQWDIHEELPMVSVKRKVRGGNPPRTPQKSCFSSPLRISSVMLTFFLWKLTSFSCKRFMCCVWSSTLLCDRPRCVCNSLTRSCSISMTVSTFSHEASMSARLEDPRCVYLLSSNVGTHCSCSWQVCSKA